MAWTATFSPYPGKETVGDMTAVYNQGQQDECVYTGSVNLDVPETLADFVAKARAALVEKSGKKDKEDARAVKFAAAVVDELNGG